MNADDLARRVARDLAPEYGADLAKSTEAAIRGEQTRGWGEAIHAGAFLLGVCRLAWDIYKDVKTTPELKSAVLAKAEKPAGLSKEKAEAIVDDVVEQLMEFGS